MDNELSRRIFLKRSFITGLGLAAMDPLSALAESREKGIKFGLVTYQWGKDWDLPTLIANCEKAGYSGVELRTQHAHGVETKLSPAQRAEVKKRFADSKVTFVGYGSNFEFHSPDQAVVRKNIEQTKEYIQLCKDIGASGIKIKPNNLPAVVPKEKTIAQIAASFNEIGKYAGDFGQLVRVEVHGLLTQEIPDIKAIFEQVTESNVKICWNSNDTDLLPPGFEANFNSVKIWVGDTIHVRELSLKDYPYHQLFHNLARRYYNGWVLLEASSEPTDKIAAMKEQLSLFNQMKAIAGRINEY